MTDNAVYIVKNSAHKPCKTCGEDHEFVSKSSDGRRCGTPAAFSASHALVVAAAVGATEDDIQRPPEGMIVVLDDSARKLPHSTRTESALRQRTSKTTLM